MDVGTIQQTTSSLDRVDPGLSRDQAREMHYPGLTIDPTADIPRRQAMIRQARVVESKVPLPELFSYGTKQD